MSAHNICFRKGIRKISTFCQMEKAPYLELCLWLNKRCRPWSNCFKDSDLFIILSAFLEASPGTLKVASFKF